MKNVKKANTNIEEPNERILIWDLPTRVFHWLMVVAFSVAWLTHDDNRYLDIHVFAGYVLLGLLAFRLLWGMVGSHYARFRAFAYDWPSVWTYLKGLATGQAARHLGHNPAGSWAILIILVLGFAVTLSGLVVLGGEEGHGPLGGLISFQLGTTFREPHEVLAWIMAVVIALHVLGVVAESLLHRENLVWSMVTGYKEAAEGETYVSRHGILGVLLLALALISALTYFRGYITATKDQPYIPFLGPRLADNAVWRRECGECHLAFHPTLLPARSWEKLLSQQDDHFGERLDLDLSTLDEIRRFSVANAAESQVTEPAIKVNRSIRPEETPLRITETRYWKRKHREVPELYWTKNGVESKSNCGACHLDATAGTFEDAAMHLPDLTTER